MKTRISEMSFDEITINNAIALFEECITNAEIGMPNFYAWYHNSEDQIKDAIKDLESLQQVLKEITDD